MNLAKRTQIVFRFCLYPINKTNEANFRYIKEETHNNLLVSRIIFNSKKAQYLQWDSALFSIFQ